MPLQEIMNFIGEIAKDTLNIIDVNNNTAISLFLKILCNNELAPGEELLEHTTGTVALVGTLSDKENNSCFPFLSYMGCTETGIL